VGRIRNAGLGRFEASLLDFGQLLILFIVLFFTGQPILKGLK